MLKVVQQILKHLTILSISYELKYGNIYIIRKYEY